MSNKNNLKIFSYLLNYLYTLKYKIIIPGINIKHSILFNINIKYSKKLYPIFNKFKYKNEYTFEIEISKQPNNI